MNDLPTGKLRPVSLSDSVREELISLIVAGVLKPGQRLNEVHLAEAPCARPRANWRVRG